MTLGLTFGQMDVTVHTPRAMYTRRDEFSLGPENYRMHCLDRSVNPGDSPLPVRATRGPGTGRHAGQPTLLTRAKVDLMAYFVIRRSDEGDMPDANTVLAYLSGSVGSLVSWRPLR
jgi:hypothetical protein